MHWLTVILLPHISEKMYTILDWLRTSRILNLVGIGNSKSWSSLRQESYNWGGFGDACLYHRTLPFASSPKIFSESWFWLLLGLLFQRGSTMLTSSILWIVCLNPKFNPPGGRTTGKKKRKMLGLQPTWAGYSKASKTKSLTTPQVYTQVIQEAHLHLF